VDDAVIGKINAGQQSVVPGGRCELLRG